MLCTLKPVYNIGLNNGHVYIFPSLFIAPLITLLAVCTYIYLRPTFFLDWFPALILPHT